ncbi:MAG: fructosamine kinase family protein [Gammaproteobacteria bacterium]
MPSKLHADIEAAIGKVVLSIIPLSGGCIAEVYQVRLADQSSIVAKVDNNRPARLVQEGAMLNYLAEYSRLPVPDVLHCSAGLLLIEFLEGESRFSDSAQRCAAELLVDLHSITTDSFGFGSDTLIGGLHQPNQKTTSWLQFFRDQRLLYMGGEAVNAGRMPHTMLARLEKFSEKLDNWLTEPRQPALLHGDVWTTNVLAQGGRITGFIDPAIYYGHPEIELAFTTLFGTFGAPFFQRYNEIWPIEAGFMEQRKDIYNLYPLLVHVRLFGGSYVQSVDKILSRFGY